MDAMVAVLVETGRWAERVAEVVQMLACHTVRTVAVVSTGNLHNKSVVVRRGRQARHFPYRSSRFLGRRVGR